MHDGEDGKRERLIKRIPKKKQPLTDNISPFFYFPSSMMFRHLVLSLLGLKYSPRLYIHDSHTYIFAYGTLMNRKITHFINYE